MKNVPPVLTPDDIAEAFKVIERHDLKLSPSGTPKSIVRDLANGTWSLVDAKTGIVHMVCPLEDGLAIEGYGSERMSPLSLVEKAALEWYVRPTSENLEALLEATKELKSQNRWRTRISPRFWLNRSHQKRLDTPG